MCVASASTSLRLHIARRVTKISTRPAITITSHFTATSFGKLVHVHTQSQPVRIASKVGEVPKSIITIACWHAGSVLEHAQSSNCSKLLQRERRGRGGLVTSRGSDELDFLVLVQ
jgi:hypothetical protein